MKRGAHASSWLVAVLGLLIVLGPAGLSAAAEGESGAKKKKEEPPAAQKGLRRPPPAFSEDGPGTVPKAGAKVEGRLPYEGDLQVSRILLTRTAVPPGGTVVIHSVVKNTGNKTARCAVETHLTENPSLVGPSTRIDRRDTTVGRAGSKDVYVRLDLPLTHPVGPHFVVVVVDADDAVEEQDEGNNRLSEALEIESPQKPAMARSIDVAHDLGLYEFEISETDLASEDHVDVGFRLKNQGDALVRQVSYEIFISSVPAGSPGFRDSRIASLYTGTEHDLDPDANVHISREVTIPMIRVGSPPHYLSVWAEGEGDVDDDPGNNGRSVPIDLDPDALPDLAVSRFELRRGEPPPEGALFDVDFTIENVGARASSPCRYEVSLHWEEAVLGDFHFDPTRGYDVPALEPGASIRGSLKFEAHEGATWSWITISVDPGDAVPEVDDFGNNRVTLSLEMEPSE